jgi:hypothetical protein
MAEIPHVITKQEALVNVDVFRDFKTEKELSDFIDTCQLIGVGTNAIVFLTPAQERCDVSEILFRMEIQNPVGYDWTKALLEKLICDYPSYIHKLQNLLEKLEVRVKPRSMKTQIKNSKDSIKKQIAGHNAAYRRDPMLTMPINSYYTFQDHWLGIRIRYFDGVPLGEAFPDAQLSDYALALLKDTNPRNVLVGISNSQVVEALIDIWDFTPSNEDLGHEKPQHLYKDL